MHEGVPWRGSARALILVGYLLARGTNSMSDKFFVDTNILVYAHDRSTGSKHQLARSLIEKLWNSGGGVLSTQVLQELCVNLRRKPSRPLSAEETRALIQDYLSWEVVINTAESSCKCLTSKLATRFLSGMRSLFKPLAAPVRRFSTQKTCRTGKPTVWFV